MKSGGNKKVIQGVVVGAVVLWRNKILILRRHADEKVYPGMWELPSGKREFFESSRECVRREVKEETGLDIEVRDPFSVFEYRVEKLNEIRDTTQVNFFVSLIAEMRVVISREHQAFAWVGNSELAQYPMTRETKEVIKKAFLVARDTMWVGTIT